MAWQPDPNNEGGTIWVPSASDPQTTPVEKPPTPDGWTGWRYQASTNSWVIPKGQESAHEQWVAGNAVQGAATNYADNAPSIADAQAAGFGTENIADKRTGQENGTAGGMAVPTVDTTQTDQARIMREQALADQRRVLEKSLNLQIDPVEQQALQQRYLERGISAANTVAANARGGAGAVAAARGQVINQTPQMAGVAAEQARNEELAMFNARVQQASTAGGIANTIGQTATSAFGQEAGLATNTAQVGLQAIDRIQAETGMKINADIQQQQQLGTMLSDVFQLGFNYDSLDIKTQQDIFDQIAQSHHIDQQVAGQIKAAAAANKKGPMDYVMGFLGATEHAAGTVAKLGL